MALSLNCCYSIIFLIFLASVSCFSSYDNESLNESLSIYCVKSNESQQCNDVQCKSAVHCATLNDFTKADNSSYYLFLFSVDYEHEHIVSRPVF